MSVGVQTSNVGIDQSLTDLAVGVRNVMAKIARLNTLVTNGVVGDALTTLEGMGYNPTDAARALALIGFLNTVSGVYFGSVQQGGAGGTGASVFDFDNALSVLWAGQLD